MKLRIRIDGAAQPNPGRGSCAAVFFRGQDNFPYAAKSKYLGIVSNNVAEHEGLILALTSAIQMGFKNVLVESDSMVVVNQFNNTWTVSSPTLQELVKKERELASRLAKVEVVWVGRDNVIEAHTVAGFELEQRSDVGKVHTYALCVLAEDNSWSPIKTNDNKTIHSAKE